MAAYVDWMCSTRGGIICFIAVGEIIPIAIGGIMGFQLKNCINKANQISQQALANQQRDSNDHLDSHCITSLIPLLVVCSVIPVMCCGILICYCVVKRRRDNVAIVEERMPVEVESVPTT